MSSFIPIPWAQEATFASSGPMCRATESGYPEDRSLNHRVILRAADRSLGAGAAVRLSCWPGLLILDSSRNVGRTLGCHGCSAWVGHSSLQCFRLHL